MEQSAEFLTTTDFVIGAKGGRRWPVELKGAIVAETLEPGATVAGVAKRWDIGANMVSTWRGMAKRGELILPALAPCDAPSNVGAGIEFASLAVAPETASFAKSDAALEIRVGSAVLCLPSDSPASRIAEIMLAVGDVARDVTRGVEGAAP